MHWVEQGDFFLTIKTFSSSQNRPVEPIAVENRVTAGSTQSLIQRCSEALVLLTLLIGFLQLIYLSHDRPVVQNHNSLIQNGGIPESGYFAFGEGGLDN